MPDLQNIGLQKLIEAARSRQARQGSRRKHAQNTVIHDLGCDDSGANQYLIAAEIEGKRRNYRGIELPSADPQSERPQTTWGGVAEEALARWVYHTVWKKSEFLEVAAFEPLVETPLDQASLLDRLAQSTGTEKRNLVCDAETFNFNQTQRKRLSPMLWAYILEYRNSKNHEDLVAVGSAIRKYVAMLDASQLGQLAELLEPGYRASLSPDLQLEVAKMVYRKFEANPPVQPEPQPKLAGQLWDIAQAYLNPHVLLHDKFATIASLCIEAIVAMRSRVSDDAVKAAFNTPYKWFGEMVGDNLKRLARRWQAKNTEAAKWCDGIVRN